MPYLLRDLELRRKKNRANIRQAKDSHQVPTGPFLRGGAADWNAALFTCPHAESLWPWLECETLSRRH